MIAVFVLIAVTVLSILCGAHWYLWRRLVRDTTVRGSKVRRAGTVIFVAAPLLTVATLVGERAGAPFPLLRVIAWPGLMWMAVFLYLLLGLLVGELVRPFLLRWLARRARATAAEPVAEPVTVPPSAAHPVTVPTAALPEPESALLTRRIFVSRAVGGAAAAVTVATVGRGAHAVLRGPRVKRITVPLARLPRSAHGFRIAVVSDVHLSPVLGRGFAERVVATINSTQADLVAVVGDLVDGSVDDLRGAVAPLAGLRSRHGTFFVTGNHEYFSGAEQWVAHVQELGMRLLANSRAELPGFDLAGVNDLSGEREDDGPDFTAALGDRDRTRTAVLLAHQPAVIHDAVRHGVDLQLSGHTHGGQLWPGPYVAELANPTVAGLERYDDTQLYVSRGVGAWGPPVRVGAPSDITVVELASRRA